MELIEKLIREQAMIENRSVMLLTAVLILAVNQVAGILFICKMFRQWSQ